MTQTILKNMALCITGMALLSTTACDHTKTTFKPLAPNAVILAFGDSLTFGMGATRDTSYPADLEKITGFKTINAGISGEETSGGLARLPNELAKTKPNLVILCLGANDLIHKRPPSQIKENLAAMIKLIKDNGAQVMLIGAPMFELSLDVPSFYKELGEEFTIPVDTTILPELEKNSALKSDLIHFNAAGYQTLAEYIAEFLKDHGAITLIHKPVSVITQ